MLNKLSAQKQVKIPTETKILLPKFANQINTIINNISMKVNQTKGEQKGLNIAQKIGLCLLVITIILYYVLSIQFLAS
ncbi:hypothetical protein [Flavobacterium piscis]|uniref:Tetrahydromethanopterin S-methyltransferase subunit G n=1 Tax=Flavobacterium piscis TaxID=1114874 RepID=A0ABU1YEJ0_9FLAO|nr:hypothetical protein [Flavobacterium piscis]MDR7212648.1 tetrahydromethanopterin S-methyltransferase subunit G [Flavobacterium piscis]